MGHVPQCWPPSSRTAPWPPSPWRTGKPDDFTVRDAERIKQAMDGVHSARSTNNRAPTKPRKAPDRRYRARRVHLLALLLRSRQPTVATSSPRKWRSAG